ncbi:E4 ubiquitin-protein ligase [Ceratobasidium theobromae]|uniref:E4 ubiquitin-protein ligase n=1 Tax=Ceratobasidium theobromae TaxID=1582974 RepID=A0A5N5QA13_9AGAM|nr:E4 ubiquitin-protein ligase [Ceratobasidium theobromae]
MVSNSHLCPGFAVSDVRLQLCSDILTEEEMDSIKMMAIRLLGHVSQRNYKRIRYSYREKMRILTLQRLHTRVASLSGATPVVIDCCIKVCHVFTGKKANLEACELCGEARYDARGRPRKVFEYLPLTPRFQAMLNNPEFIQKMLYRHNYAQEDGIVDNIFDSKLYKRLCTSSITVDSVETGTRFEHFNIPEPRLFILAHITQAKGTLGDATEILISFRQMGRSFVVDVQAIENVVGRVKTKGVIPSGEWVIIDRRNGACRTSFNEVDDKYEE